MEFRHLILYPAISVLITLLVIPFLTARHKSLAAVLIVLLISVLTSLPAVHALSGAGAGFTTSVPWMFGELLFRLDPLAAWFVLIINITCLAGGWYGVWYMKAYLSQRDNLSIHWILFVVFHYSMILVVTANDGLTFLIFWEIMSMSSFILVIFDHTRFTILNAGINYLVQAHIGVLMLSGAFIWIWVSEDSLAFSAVASLLSGENSFWLFLLFLTGFGFKAGFVPLHTWLPHAHPAAPAHVSGIMSGVMVTMGIYGIMRMAGLLSTNLLLTGVIVFVVSLITVLYGILSAAIHRDYKRLLAFSTIENMGITGMGIGIGLIGKETGQHALIFLGFAGTLLHVLNHSLYKPLLFFCTGNLYQLTHTRNMEHLGGLAKKLPYTTFFFLCGAVAIAGLPPFNGFISKFLVFSAMIEGITLESFEFNILMIAGIIGLAMAGGLSVLTFSRSFSVIFLGTPRNKSRHQPQEYLNAGYAPLSIILFLMIFIGLSPALVLSPAQRIVDLYDPPTAQHTFSSTLMDTFPGIGIASLLFILLAALIYFVRTRTLSRKITDAQPTWGCGYAAPNTRMQYTGKSFSKSLAKLFTFITGEEKKYTEIPRETVFPSNRSYQSSYAEFFEKNIINKMLNQLLNAMNHFTFIHNGRVQYYVLYGFIFILLVIIATFSNILQG